MQLACIMEYTNSNADVMLDDQHQRDPNVVCMKFIKNVAMIGATINHFTMTWFDGIPMTIGDKPNRRNKARIKLLISTPHQCK